MAGSIVMWGAPLSGKTTYAASLVFWQEHTEEPERDRRLCVLPANLATTDWVVNRARTLAGGQPLQKTNTIERLDFRLYELPPERPPRLALPGRRPAPSRQLAELSLWDAPGEVFARVIPGELLPTLVVARGLIIVVNPFADDSASARRDYYWTFFNLALDSVRRAMEEASDRGDTVAYDPKRRRIRYPVAICLSQIDRAADPTRDPREWLRDLLGRDEKILTGWLERFHVFSFSALGRGGAAGTDPRPFNVMPPLSWVVRESNRIGS